jgi:single-strand DNA-binding protein
MKDLKNKVQLIGNLGNDPEIKNLENGRKLAKFSLATNQVYTDQKGEKVEDTQWHNIVAWVKMLIGSKNSLPKDRTSPWKVALYIAIMKIIPDKKSILQKL